jgi:glycosyltransferase involved in cell wall biosynthesis
VIIPAYNESSLILRCLDGLSIQSRAAQKIVVVDDSSTDDTSEKASEFGRDHPSLNIQVVRHKKVGGYDIMGNYTSMLVLGWSQLEEKPDYFAICDADTILGPNYYERILSVLERNSRIGIAGGELLPEPGMPHWWRKKKILGVYQYVYGCNRVYSSKCWEELLRNHDPVSVLGYVGVDTYHALLARALGWQVAKIPDAISIAMRPPASLVSSRLKGVSSYVLGYSLPQIVGRALLNRDREYLEGWLWARSVHLPRLPKIQPLVRDLFRKRLLHAVLGGREENNWQQVS